MLSLVRSFPDHLEDSSGLQGLENVVPLPSGCRRIVFCGMGGSAIAGDLVQPLLQDQSVSLTVWRDYGLPHWVTEQDLVIVASYSGNTEEALSALTAARAVGCRVLGISSAGALQGFATATDGSGFALVTLPGGLPPRAALGHGLGALLHVLAGLDVIPDPTDEIAAICSMLRENAAAWLHPWTSPGAAAATDTDPKPGSIRGLALELRNRIPALYTAGLEAHGAGIRWRAQLNENSKSPACLAAFPELDHNDLVGWCLPEDLRSRFNLIILDALDPDPRQRLRVDATEKLLAKEFAAIHRVVGVGETPMARSLFLVQYGDYLSCHLAHIREIDPMPVDRIESLKTILAQGLNSSPTDYPQGKKD
jgi:glucose/mannose-6-phosphate isomerase